MVEGEFLEAAWQLLDAMGVSRADSTVRPHDTAEETTPLTEREQHLAHQIQERRGISAAVAEDLVRWCRTQPSGRQS